MDESWEVLIFQDEHYEWDLNILKLIFNRVNEDIVDLIPECDNAIILKKLHEAGLMSEEECESVISCVTNSDKNK